MRAASPQRSARDRADRPPCALRQVRRAEVPGGRPRQGLHRRRAVAGQPARRDRVVSGCCACTTASAQPGRAPCSTRCARTSPTPSTRHPDAVAAAPAATRTQLAATLDMLASGPRAAHPSPRGPKRVLDLLRPLLTARYPDHAARLGDLDRLVGAAAESPTLADYVASLTLDPPASTSDLAGPPHVDEDYLVLSTVHSAKGLEWDSVHVINVIDGAFPSDMALDQCRRADRGAAPLLRRRHPCPRRAEPSTHRCGYRITAVHATTGTATRRPAGSSTRRHWPPWTFRSTARQHPSRVRPRRSPEWTCPPSTNCGLDGSQCSGTKGPRLRGARPCWARQVVDNRGHHRMVGAAVPSHAIVRLRRHRNHTEGLFAAPMLARSLDRLM